MFIYALFEGEFDVFIRNILTMSHWIYTWCYLFTLRYILQSASSA